MAGVRVRVRFRFRFRIRFRVRVRVASWLWRESLAKPIGFDLCSRLPQLS